jgi:hypothetical protein
MLFSFFGGHFRRDSPGAYGFAAESRLADVELDGAAWLARLT